MTVQIEARRTGERVTVIVSDDGPGIPEAHRTRVFERFHRVMDRDAGGGGLGLPIARELVQAMGGELSLKESDSGTSFVVELPA